METPEVKKTTKKTSGSKTTEIVLGSAATKIAAGVKALGEAVVLVNSLEQKAQDQTLIVTNLEDKIGGLEQDLKNKIAQNKIEIEQNYNSDKKSFVDKWCSENNSTVILVDSLRKLENDLEDAVNKKEYAINKAVAIATNTLKTSHANEMKVKELELQNKEANNAAEISQLKNQNKFLEEQVGHWKTMLDTQMKNETERSKYGQIQTLNVGTDATRR